MKGLIFNIKRYAIHDGPGIRVTVFMKGCPLGCWWCHNPEGIASEPEKVINKNRVGEREFQNLETVGRYYSVNELMEIIRRERIFIEKSSGGVTFSGGEPLLQADFLKEALSACREAGFHTAVDTSGFSPAETLRKILPVTNLFLFDLKHLDPVKHQLYTGVSNDMILSNLDLIISHGSDLMLRIPVIPGYNDSEQDMDHLRNFIGKKNGSIKMISLLPYHKTGSSKYLKFKRVNRMGDTKQPDQSRMRQLRDYFSETGIRVKIGG